MEQEGENGAENSMILYWMGYGSSPIIQSMYSTFTLQVLRVGEALLGKAVRVRHVHDLEGVAAVVYDDGRVVALLAAGGVVRADEGLPHELLQIERREDWYYNCFCIVR